MQEVDQWYQCLCYLTGLA